MGIVRAGLLLFPDDVIDVEKVVRSFAFVFIFPSFFSSEEDWNTELGETSLFSFPFSFHSFRSWQD